MDIEIQDIIEAGRPKPSLRKRFTGFFRKQAKLIAWKLWGRRKAIARLRLLAGLNPKTPPKEFDPPKTVNITVFHTGREPIPSPDSDDIN